LSRIAIVALVALLWIVILVRPRSPGDRTAGLDQGGGRVEEDDDDNDSR